MTPRVKRNCLSDGPFPRRWQRNLREQQNRIWFVCHRLKQAPRVFHSNLFSAPQGKMRLPGIVQGGISFHALALDRTSGVFRQTPYHPRKRSQRVAESPFWRPVHPVGVNAKSGCFHAKMFWHRPADLKNRGVMQRGIDRECRVFPRLENTEKQRQTAPSGRALRQCESMQKHPSLLWRQWWQPTKVLLQIRLRHDCDGACKRRERTHVFADTALAPMMAFSGIKASEQDL